MDYLQILLGIAAIQLLGAASPGPTFIVVSGYSINESRRYGLLAALGVLSATFAWAVLAVCGLATVIGSFPAIHTLLQFAGAAYLVWLGGKMLIGALRKKSSQLVNCNIKEASPWQAIRAGFLTNATNPKSIAYYSSLFATVMPPDPPIWFFAAAVATALFVSATWWFTVAFLFAIPRLRQSYARAQRTLNAVLGGLLLCLGLRLALAR